MEDDYSKSTFKKGSSSDEVFMHYYSADFLKNELTKNNFQIIHLERKEYIHNEENTTDLIIVAEGLK